jgi:N-6 DNA Methylase
MLILQILTFLYYTLQLTPLTQINQILSKFDMGENSGLVFTATKNTENPIEILALHQAEKFGATAVYFRRFENSQSSVPQIYIYDQSYDSNQLVELHRKLWSSGTVPFFYIITDTKVQIFSCTKKANIKNNELKVSPLDTIQLINEVQDAYNYQKYSARLFDNGTFWESDKNKELIDSKNSPYQTLLEGLLSARKYLEKEYIGILNNGTIGKLLIMCVLVKYLEEKQDDKGQKLLEIERDLYTKFPNSEQFTDILRNGQCVPFFEYLANKFNGKIFHLEDDEKIELKNANLTYVAEIFDATIDKKGQYVIWKLYSFNYLPIELISGIYEAFLNKKGKNGVVYTPPFLVNLLVDECMPIYKAEEYFSEENFKVLDPSCGSGIFLVTALKRMIQWKAVINYKKTGIVQYPEPETIKRIIRNNIFGVDIEKEATLITIFSLSIALCDKLSPMQVWDNLKFDDLSVNNIQTKNFFQFFNETPKENFDLVIGNPPFNPPSEKSNKDYYKILQEEYNTESSFAIHDNNLALLFWDRATLLCKSHKSICLILPSGTWLYNNNALDYRKHFLETFDVKKIIDFTHLSDVLFHGSANVAVCATIAQNRKPSKENLLHIAIKRSNSSEKRAFFEIDHYDFNAVNYDTALNNQYVWKANLLGGGSRLLRLINRLSNLRSLEDYLNEKKKNNGWEFGEGYIVGHDGTKSEEELLKKKHHNSPLYKKSEWITDKKTVLTDDFSEEGIGYSTEKEEYFAWPRIKELFSPPHILIKENLGQQKIPVKFSDEYLCFKHKIVGIHAPNEQRRELEKLYHNIEKHNTTFRSLLISISGQAGITFSNTVLLKTDIVSLPYPEDELDLQLSQSETIIRDDVLNYLMKSGQDSKNSLLNKNAIEPELTQFGEVFCKILNPIYATESMAWQVDSFKSFDKLTVYAFRFGKITSESIINLNEGDFSKTEDLIYNQTQQNTRITRVLRSYLHHENNDVLILVKPNLMRYWLKSVALRDADETFADLKRAGL